MSSNSFKLISLNIEKDFHKDSVLQFLKKENPDIICLQEIFKETFELFKSELGFNGVFCHQVTYRTEDGIGHSEGLAIFSRLEITRFETVPYTNTNENEISEINIKDLPEDNKHKSFINKQHHRKLLMVSLLDGDKEWHISTTHFTWAYYGHFDKENGVFVWRINQSTVDEQMEDARRLINIFDSFPDLVFCADLNAPRGEQVFDTFASKLKDNIPTKYKTSIDQEIHRAGVYLPLMIDGVFTTKEYLVNNVILKSGISDHLAVVCEIKKTTSQN